MNTRANTLASSPAEPAISGLYPLEDFYARRAGAAPIVQTDSGSFEALTKSFAGRGQTALIWAPVEAAAVPEPYRSLLVHGADMTSTLENFYKERLHVEMLGRHVSGQEYFREVVLRLDHSGRRVEFGAIKMLLDLFPAEARQEILRERQPLGRILTESGLEFSSQPRAYLRLASDDFINRTLGLSGPQFLYGRRNTLVDAWERPLAEIVEILPPS
jgi:chorismate-pyruvate lyase